jgi:hypothetical protein
MAKIEKKKSVVIDGGVYDHETRTITVEIKDDCIEIPIDDVLSEIDGYNIKLVASTDIIED